MSKLHLQRVGDTQAVFTRQFAASPESVYKAHMEPSLLQQWLLGPEGWSMPVCVSENKVGGQIRYEWVNEDGQGFYLTGEFTELCPFSKISQVQRMFLPDPTPDSHVETTFEPRDGGTLMTLRMNLPSKEALEEMLATGMESGMEDSYVRLETLN